MAPTPPNACLYLSKNLIAVSPEQSHGTYDVGAYAIGENGRQRSGRYKSDSAWLVRSTP